jgi:hypothetical protein
MASTTRSGTKYSRSVARQQEETSSHTGISLNLDLNHGSAGTVPRIQHNGQEAKHENISSNHLAHSTGNYADFDDGFREESVQTGQDRASDVEEIVFCYSAEFSESIEKPEVIQGHSEEGATKSNIQQKISLTPEQINRIQQNRKMAMERLAKRNAEKISFETQVQVIHGMIKNENKSGTCAYSEIVTPDKELRMKTNESQGDVSSDTAAGNLPRGHDQITLTLTQRIRIQRNRLNALKRLRTK